MLTRRFLPSPLLQSGILALCSVTLSQEAEASLFNLNTTYDAGTYTYSFTDSVWPIAFGLGPESGGSVFFKVPDASNIIVPEDWALEYNVDGFTLHYSGALPMYPLGYLPLEVSFDSVLTPDDVDPAKPYTGPLSGHVSGPVILDNGQQASSQQNPDGSFVSPTVGYQSFYFDAPDPVFVPLNAPVLATLGLVPQDFVPVVSEFTLEGDYAYLKLNTIIDEVTYYLQYRPSLKSSNWVEARQFTSADLDAENCISVETIGSQGFYRIVMPE